MESREEGRIFVSVRIRPLNEKEISSKDVSDWECINGDTIVYKNASLLTSESLMYPTSYTFDRVFGSDCSTRTVYEQGAKNIALSVVHGVNSTIFAYGPTSSGKTYTMTGITEYAITDIYDYIEKHPEREFILKFSAMEIHKESVRDLLSVDSTPVRLIDPKRGTIIENLTEEILRDRDHLTELLFICEACTKPWDKHPWEGQPRRASHVFNFLPEKTTKTTGQSQVVDGAIKKILCMYQFDKRAQRQTEETSFNDMSSSSHQIIRLTVESSPRDFLCGDNASTHVASLNLVDLAGSEQADQSLLNFGSAVHKLRNNKAPNGRNPYRDSKLTQMLQTSLRTDARTTILCTMSPARSHVEQSRNTLYFASCAKEVSTNAHVEVGMSDKDLVKNLQDEITRLENELRSTQASFTSLNYSALLREKDAHIEKLEKEVKELILQRDISQSHVKKLSRMLGESASSITQVHYPHLRVHISPDRYIQQLDTPTDPQCNELIRSNSLYHNAKIPFSDENFDQHNASPSLLPSGSSFSESDSFYGLQEFEKQIRGNLEDLYRKVGRLETEQSRSRETSEDNAQFPEIKVHVNGDDVSSIKDDDTGNISSGIMPLKEGHEMISASIEQEKESYNASLAHNLAQDSFGNRHFIVARSTSSDAGGITVADSASPWFKMTDSIENTPYNGSEKESVRCPLNLRSGLERLSGAENFSTAQDCTTCTRDIREEDAQKLAKFPMKNVKFDESDLKEDEIRLTSWPVEFRRLRREMIELWHACNVSLVHRSYFFILFQGDPSDAIYLEVEIRRTKVLKDKFSRSEKIVVDGRRLTISSSAKALRQERKMLSEQMMKKFTEEERQKLFTEWGIGLNTKLRRLQLAQLLWSKTDDVNHITESAFLVAKLAGFIEPEQTPSREMFEVSFTPKSSTGIGTFRRSLGLGSLL